MMKPHAGAAGHPVRCDIFCRVVDNFGDVGVTWRLARQLGAEYGWQVRLIVDDLPSLQRLVPEIKLDKHQQRCCLTDIFVWNAPLDIEFHPEVVIEAFACTLPEGYVERMANAVPAPVWLNLEYLSAEPWVESHHLLGSLHPQLPLRRTFFFPGFTEKTGGLLRERGLIESHMASERAVAQTSLEARHPPRAFLFGYLNPAAHRLVAAMQASGLSVDAPRSALAASLRAEGENVAEREFVPQTAFDALLAEYDVLFVRGEDSFVRAQWAARPFVWQIYPQEDDIHLAKLDAFLDRYCEGMDAQLATAFRGLWAAWNRADADAIGSAWQQFWDHRNALLAHARQWRARLATQADLAAQIVTFCEKMIKI